jgi:hypothetical protein
VIRNKRKYVKKTYKDNDDEFANISKRKEETESENEEINKKKYKIDYNNSVDFQR